MQTKALDEDLQAARGELSAAERQLAALARTLGAASPAELQPALQARLSLAPDERH